MKNNQKCRAAIIGYGGMGSFHAALIRTMEEVELAGIYDILPQRREVAEKAGIYSYQSLDALLNDESVDIITIATPNDVHKDLAVLSMNAGKNVICEKPVALNSAELNEMIDSSIKNNVVFTVHQNRRWDEDYLVVKKLYEESTLGRVFNIESRVHGSRGVPGDWRNEKARGGGMVLDWGVHLLDQILMMTGKKVVSTYAVLTHVTNNEIDDGFKIILTLEDGMTALVETGTSNFVNLPRWYVQGENGTAVINDWYLNGKIVMVSDWENRDAVPVVTAAGLTKTMAPRTDDTIKEYPLPRIPSDVRDFYRNVVNVINGKESLIVTHEQIRRSMKLMEAVFRSAEINQVIYDVI